MRAWVQLCLELCKRILKEVDVRIQASVLLVAIMTVTAVSFQNCSKVSFKAVSTDNSSLATANFCQPNQPQTCDVLDSAGVKVGVGTFICDSKTVKSSSDLVRAASNCQLGSCLSGYRPVGNTCLPNTCSTNPASTTKCNDVNSSGVITGVGVATCKADGSGYGSCVLDANSCSAGFVFNASTKKCDPKPCDPNPSSASSKRSCDQAAGTGYQYCLADGSGYEAACVYTACKSGYHEVPQAGIPAHSGVQCEPNICTPKSGPYPCTDANKTGTGTMTCNDYGTGYNACVLTACTNPPYKSVPEGGVCVNTPCSVGAPVTCTVANGSGVKICDSNGQVPTGSCPVTKCDSGYVIVAGTSCLKQVCDPKTPALANKCTIPNATGTVQSCNADGTLLGDCQVTSCAANYTVSTDKKSCVLSACSNGAFNYNDPVPANVCTICAPGSEMWPLPISSTSKCVGQCAVQDGFNRQSDGTCKCSVGSVSPKGSSSCNVNGSGQLKCVADGSGFACEYTSCALGYQLNTVTKQCAACSAVPTGASFTSAGSCAWSCDVNQGLIKSSDGKSCIPSNPVCGNGQYSIQGVCSGVCTNKPSNSVYTSSGTNATNCAYACNSGYVGTDCHSKYEWSEKSVTTPATAPQQCGTQISQNYSVICIDSTTTPVTTVSSSLCEAATKPDVRPSTSYVYRAADCTCPTGQVQSATRESCEDIVCSAGQYLSGSSCNNCPSGTTSPEGSRSSSACVATCSKAPTYSSPIVGGSIGGVLDSSTCSYNYTISCNPGNYWSTITDSALVSAYQVSGQSCQKCPAGSSCAGDKVAPVLCPENKYAAAGASTCTSCPTGTIAPAGSTSASACVTECTKSPTYSGPVVGGWVAGTLNSATCSYNYTGLTCNGPTYVKTAVNDPNLATAYGLSNQSCQCANGGTTSSACSTCPSGSYMNNGSCSTCTLSATKDEIVVGGYVSGTLNASSCSYTYNKLTCNSGYTKSTINDVNLATAFGLSNQSCQCSNGGTLASSCASCPSGSYMKDGACTTCSLAPTKDEVVTGGHVQGTLNAATCSYNYTGLVCNVAGYTKTAINDPNLATAFGLSNQSCQCSNGGTLSSGCSSCPSGSYMSNGSCTACTLPATRDDVVTGGYVSGTLSASACSYTYTKLTCNSGYTKSTINDSNLALAFGLFNQSCQCANGGTTSSACTSCPSGSYMSNGSCTTCNLPATTTAYVVGGYVSGTRNDSSCSFTYTSLTCTAGYTKSTVNDPALALTYGLSNQSCQKLPSYACGSPKLPSSTCYQSGTCIAQGDIVNIVNSSGCEAGAGTATNIATANCGGSVACWANWTCPNGSGGTISCSANGTAVTTATPTPTPTPTPVPTATPVTCPDLSVFTSGKTYCCEGDLDYYQSSAFSSMRTSAERACWSNFSY